MMLGRGLVRLAAARQPAARWNSTAGAAAASTDASTEKPAAAAPPAPAPAPPVEVEAKIEDFMKLKLITARVTSVEAHPQADKLWVLRYAYLRCRAI